MNALAGIDTGTEPGGMTLWSSHRPCMMCAAACEFTGVGTVIFIAPDPSDDNGGEDPDGIETEWVIAANLLFLSGVAAYSGSSSPMIVRAGQREPEITHLMRIAGETALRQPALRDALAPGLARHTGRRQGTAQPPGTRRIGRPPRGPLPVTARQQPSQRQPHQR